MYSSRSSTPSPVLALTGTTTVSPPYSSGTRLSWVRSVLTRSMSACGKSILLMATIRGILAAWACATASRVCGMIESSAATTMMAMSATFAPRARMVVKASWPGVSMKTILPLLVLASKAPTCWVMPPASLAATLVLRM